jgi:hypothetical protein
MCRGQRDQKMCSKEKEIKQVLDLFHVLPQILFTCLMFELDLRHSSKDIQVLEYYLTFDGIWTLH